MKKNFRRFIIILFFTIILCSCELFFPKPIEKTRTISITNYSTEPVTVTSAYVNHTEDFTIEAFKTVDVEVDKDKTGLTLFLDGAYFESKHVFDIQFSSSISLEPDFDIIEVINNTRYTLSFPKIGTTFLHTQKKWNAPLVKDLQPNEKAYALLPVGFYKGYHFECSALGTYWISTDITNTTLYLISESKLQKKYPYM